MLVTHDSFAIPKQVKAAFERESGLKLRILQGGDAGETVNRALLTKGDPAGRRPLRDRQQPALERARRGPVRAVRGEGPRPRRGRVPDRSDAPRDADRPRRRLPQHRPRSGSPRAGSLPRPRSTTSPTPRYRKLLVVENPATSTPGLAFMLATIAQFGESGWQDYWRRLRANGVLVVDGWEEAYTAAVLRRRGQQGHAPDRRLVRDEPRRRGDLRHEAPEDGPDRGRHRAPASARSSSPASSPVRRTWTAPTP